MIEFEKLPETMKVDCSAHGFGPFYVLIVPAPDEHNENMRIFYLKHKRYGIIHEMFGLVPDNDEHAAELAYFNAPDYMPHYLKDCFSETE